jgi:hypothetical protein
MMKFIVTRLKTQILIAIILVFTVNLSGCCQGSIGGEERIRTADLLLARQALSQLSYSPTIKMCDV